MELQLYPEIDNIAFVGTFGKKKYTIKKKKYPGPDQSAQPRSLIRVYFVCIKYMDFCKTMVTKGPTVLRPPILGRDRQSKSHRILSRYKLFGHYGQLI